MAALQEALESLNPTSWEDVSTAPDDLRAYINDLSKKARLIVDSVPEPPPPTTDHYNLESDSPASRIRPSSARLGTPNPDLQSYQREWNKPNKINSARDNPLEILIHKLPGDDGKGQWFGRRSVHEGMSFTRWQEKLTSEMGETLKKNRERMKNGRTPDQAVRGIGAEQQVESIEVRDESGERVLAHVNVFHVSAQFPKPTTPRDFVSLIVSWEVGVDEESGGRFWMMASRPCEHADAPPCQGYIRGQYESVEFIREIPVKKRGAAAEGSGHKNGSPEKGPETTNGESSNSGQGQQPAKDEDEEDPNPVEWIMVTRSDPGGNIPRWMVEKGTPKSICMDAVKFLNWACRDPSSSPDETNGIAQEPTIRRRDSMHTAGVRDAEGSDVDEEDLYESEVEHHGLIASFAYLLNAGLERYAPQSVLDYLPRHAHHPSHTTLDDSSDEEDASPRPSGDSARVENASEAKKKDEDDTRSQISHSKASSINSGLATPIETGHHNISPEEIMRIEKKDGKLTSHEKQLAKLAQRKRDVEAQLEKIREDIKTLHLPPREEVGKRDKASTAALAATEPGSDQTSTGSSTQRPSPESRSNSNYHGHHTTSRETAKMHKVASGLFTEESKLLKQLGKIERQQLKEASKIEAQQRKQADREEKTRSRTEVEILRHENDHLKKELERLRNERRQWLDLIASLQTENIKLAADAGKTEN
ncbi:hypothetical protein BDV25DRAFT_155982 [Aspergillus avenaceus]|uniref:DUF3074 domain-containing protein n=1 Tax=Aspergillus avenaceus TaxID=36643 RepID=A0A5N6TTF8_ASPAV|nr:hypothetical protein BDV25DRAFT_155982 [Aspergillus avenaceus]